MRTARLLTLALALPGLTLTGLAAGLASGCSSSPQKAGDPCSPTADPAADPCPGDLFCATTADGARNVCQIQAGGACDLAAADSFCLDGKCVDDGSGAGVCIVELEQGEGCEPDNEHARCVDGLECAELAGGGHKCFEPVQLHGMVFDAETEAAIEGAHVLALDEQGTAKSDIAISDAAGEYSLTVPVPRNDDGSPAAGYPFFLRAQAQDYQTFPSGIRTALPIEVGDAGQTEGVWILDSALTDIALLLLPSDQQGLPSVAGSVLAGDDSGGVLVVAEDGSGAGLSAVSDLSGAYTIFNVPAGSYTVKGYAAGLQLEPADATVAADPVTGVDLAVSTAALGTISGKISIVNPGDGDATSVVLVVESTFNDTFVRGEVPRGLRSPLSGPPSVTGDFSIEGVPAGRYVVLAAFENDFLVRDPDTNIAGTQILHLEVPSPGTDYAIPDSFKVTGALGVVGPGAEVPEAVTGNPTLEWEDDSSEDYYTVVVYDAFGNLVWETQIPGQSGGATVSLDYAGPALESGMYYQFRATSWRQSGGQPPAPISQTEDLRGVFYVP